jgi:hypothetical protein
MLPNLLVIGAARCGTTSLHRYLGAHPDVTMSRRKELDFFVDGPAWERGPGWYAAQFDDSPVRGEASPKYAAWPVLDGVPERIVRVIPDVRLLYLVRDPIERLLSDYRVTRYVLRHDLRGPDEAIGSALGKGDRSLALVEGRYALQLDRYRECFPASQILVLASEDLGNRRRATLRRVFEFVGLPTEFPEAAAGKRHNETARTQRVGTRAAVAVLDRTIGTKRSRALRKRAPAWTTPLTTVKTDVPRPELSPATRARLVDYYHEDVARLRDLTGIAFPGWLP